MSATHALSNPFAEDWTMWQATDATAAELVQALAAHGPDTLERWHEELATALNEFHRDRICAESDRMVDALHAAWGVGDPIVALVRALASLARRCPSSRSATAQVLIDLLR